MIEWFLDDLGLPPIGNLHFWCVTSVIVSSLGDHHRPSLKQTYQQRWEPLHNGMAYQQFGWPLLRMISSEKQLTIGVWQQDITSQYCFTIGVSMTTEDMQWSATLLGMLNACQEIWRKYFSIDGLRDLTDLQLWRLWHWDCKKHDNSYMLTTSQPPIHCLVYPAPTINQQGF